MPTRITPNQYFGENLLEGDNSLILLGIIGIVVVGIVIGGIAIVAIAKKE